MNTAEPPLMMDKLAILMRWLTLVGICVSLAMQGEVAPPLSLTLLSAAIWNIGLTVLTIFNHRLPYQRLWSVAVDLALANLVFYFSRILAGPLVWAGLLVVFPAALSLERVGVLLTVFLTLVTQGAQTILSAGLLVATIHLGFLAVLYLIAGFGLNAVSGQMASVLLQAQQERAKARQKAERIESERQRSIYNLIWSLGATLNYQRVLDTALDLTATALGATTASTEHLVSAVLLFGPGSPNETRLQVASARRFTPTDTRIEIPGAGGIIGRVIDEDTPTLTKNISQDPELGRFVALRACQSLYCVPLRAGLEAYGVLLFAHPDTEYFTQERREILDIVGRQAMIALQNARLYRDLEMEKERMMEVQEESRNKLARDLHDGPTQSVAALAMRVNFARRLLERNVNAAAEELFKVEDLARRTTKEIRHMLFTLRPLVLESQGLIAALQSMAEKMRETYDQNVTIAADPNIVSQLEMNKQAVVFYIADEAVNNARKHAQAKHIWVRLKPVEADVALLEIEDDGLGFDVRNVTASYEGRGSLGLINMRERAELVNGAFSLDSSEGKGTRVRLLIPFTEEASDRLRRGA